MDGNSDCPKESQHVGATISVLCDIHTAICAVSKLHHHTVTVKVIVSTCEPRHLLFSERCKHPGLNVPWVTIEILQNQSGLQATVFLSIDPSRLYHSFAVAGDRFTVVMTPISLSEFSSFCRHLFTSLASSRMVRISFAQNRHSKDSFPHRSRR